MFPDYDGQMIYLLEHPEKIQAEWQDGYGIFAFITDNLKVRWCGCPLLIKGGMVKRGTYHAIFNGEIDYELDTIIGNMSIPNVSASQITSDMFPIFKEAQQIADRLHPDRWNNMKLKMKW